MISNLATFFSDLKIGLKSKKTKNNDCSSEQKRKSSYRTFWYGNDHNISADNDDSQNTFGCLGKTILSDSEIQGKKSKSSSMQNLDKAGKRSHKSENNGNMRNTVSMLDLNDVKNGKKINKKDKLKDAAKNVVSKTNNQSKASVPLNGKIIFKNQEKLSTKSQLLGFAKFDKEQAENKKQQHKIKDDKLKRGHSWRKAYIQGTIPIEENIQLHLTRTNVDDRFIMDKSSSSSGQNTSNEMRHLRLNSIPNQYSSSLQIFDNTNSKTNTSIINETSQTDSITPELKKSKENKLPLKNVKSLDVDLDNKQVQNIPSRKNSSSSQISVNMSLQNPTNLSSFLSTSTTASGNLKNVKMIPASPSSEAAPFSSLLRHHYPDSGNNLSPQNLMANYHPLKSLVVENNFKSPEKELLKGSSIPIVCPFETNFKELADNFQNMGHLNNKYQSKEIKQINQQCLKTSLTPQDFTDNHMPNVMSTPALTLYSKQKDKQEMYFINQYSNKKLDNKRLCSQINVVQSESNLVKNERNNKNNDVTQKKLEYDFDQKVYDSKLGVTYYKGKLLGKGGFAKCYEMKDIKTSKVFAGKIILKSTLTKGNQIEKILREVELHSCLNHKNVVGFHSFFEDSTSVYMVLEMCSRKSLVHVLKRRKSLTEPEVRYYMHHLTNGVKYIHNQKIIHRDLKLGNMLLNSSMHLKIADFGLATKIEFEGEKKMTVCGTPNYIAPEVLQKVGHSYEADIWAMGCVMYALLCGRPPFETSSLKETYLRIVTNKFSIPPHISMTARNLIKRLLSEASNRPALEKISNDNFFFDGFFPEELSPATCDSPPKFPLLSITNRITNSQFTTGNNNYAKKQCADGKMLSKNNVNNVCKKIYQTTCNKAVYPVDNRKNLRENIDNNLAKIKGSKKSASQIITRTKGEYESCANNNLKDEFSAGSSLSIHKVMDTSLIHNIPSPLSPSCLHRNFVSYLDLLLERKSEPLQPGAVGTPQNNTTINKWAKYAGICVTKWVDYSNKYGFGFQLSNECVGILFNDGTKMLLESDNLTIRVETNKGLKEHYSTTSVPNYLQKQTTLLIYFAQFMENHLISGGSVQNSKVALSNRDICPFNKNEKAVFLKRWFRTEKAVVMYLTDGTLQVNFFEDHTKVILSSNDAECVYVTLVDSNRQASTYALKSIPSLGCTPDVLERLQYTCTMIERVANEEGEGHLLPSVI